MWFIFFYKLVRISYRHSGTSGRENGTMPKRPRPSMVETDCDVTACRRTANLPGPASQKDVCSRPNHTNNLAKWKEYIG